MASGRIDVEEADRGIEADDARTASATGVTGSGRRTPATGLADRIGTFRSLGGNCEFGFVQRYCGSEASGLLRFSFTPLDDLVHALATDFSEYGTPGDLHLQETATNHYYCASRRYNIWANTRHAVGSIDPTVLLEREYGKVAHLKRAMLADLAGGAKILVRKAGTGEDPEALERLSVALGRHGPSTLLRVTESGPNRPPAPVRRISDRVLEGSVRRFASTERAWDIDLEPWVALCESAHALHHGLPCPSPHQPQGGGAMRLSARARCHRGRYDTHTLSNFLHPIRPGTLDPRRIYVFSAWVRIGDAFAGSRLHAVLGYDRLGWRDADLNLRNRWQRVWAAGRIASDALAPKLGLGLVGGRSDRFWSCGWRLDEGVVPEPSPDPPNVRIEPWYRRPVSAWLP